MNALRDLWSEFEKTARAAGASEEFEVLDPSTMARLNSQYDIPRTFREVIAERYPAGGVALLYCDGAPGRYAGSMILPSIRWLIELRVEDASWPKAWFPVSVTGDHRVQFLQHEQRGIYAINSDDWGSCPYEAPPNPDYESIEAFLQAAIATTRFLRPEAFEEVTNGRWPLRRQVQLLRDEVAERIRQVSCSPAEGPPLLPQSGVAL